MMFSTLCVVFDCYDDGCALCVVFDCYDDV